MKDNHRLLLTSPGGGYPVINGWPDTPPAAATAPLLTSAAQDTASLGINQVLSSRASGTHERSVQCDLEDILDAGPSNTMLLARTACSSYFTVVELALGLSTFS
ncbi:hypothetical protein ElyMa_005905500 [Elysia marginata]|uniref:Uncharacterized protein n=1 Tax=Elysia marginata TaxID=1093978 RepID=A0AAV4G6T5_9GAST|nr:hypothetical protein ElyMa_005905500 [Elysia marginata]